MGYWKKVQVELDEIGDSTDGIDIEKEMREAMMNEYTIKGVSYSQVEARSEAEAIQKYKENILDYICDNWEVEVIESEVVCDVCDVCDGKGYLIDVYDTEAEETQTQRCDSCKQFESDKQAREHLNYYQLESEVG